MSCIYIIGRPPAPQPRDSSHLAPAHVPRMYLRTTRRRNRDGSVVQYSQLAETRWDPQTRRPTAHIIHNFGRADALDREAPRRLARSRRPCAGPSGWTASTCP
jgi:hypothetical protein